MGLCVIAGVSLPGRGTPHPVGGRGASAGRTAMRLPRGALRALARLARGAGAGGTRCAAAGGRSFRLPPLPLRAEAGLPALEDRHARCHAHPCRGGAGRRLRVAGHRRWARHGPYSLLWLTPRKSLLFVSLFFSLALTLFLFLSTGLSHLYCSIVSWFMSFSERLLSTLSALASRTNLRFLAVTTSSWRKIRTK